LEERAEEVSADFRAMGADGSEPIIIHAEATPDAAIARLVDIVTIQHPALVVIDPLFRILRVRDEKAYAEVYRALTPLIDVARTTGTHIMVTHHSGKALKGDAIDSPLGSTAIGGAVSTLVVLKRTDVHRTVQTVQRIGQDMPEMVLNFDESTRLLSVGGSRFEADIRKCEGEIIEYLKAGGESTEPEINKHVEGKTTTKRKAIRSLIERRLIGRVGGGKKGDPYKYSFSCSAPVAGTSEQESAVDRTSA
jgi:hypothetical protein